MTIKDSASQDWEVGFCCLWEEDLLEPYRLPVYFTDDSFGYCISNYSKIIKPGSSRGGHTPNTNKRWYD